MALQPHDYDPGPVDGRVVGGAEKHLPAQTLSPERAPEEPPHRLRAIVKFTKGLPDRKLGLG